MSQETSSINSQTSYPIPRSRNSSHAVIKNVFAGKLTKVNGHICLVTRKKVLILKRRLIIDFCGSGFFFYPFLFSFLFCFCLCENVANITSVYYSVVKNVFGGNLGILWVCDTQRNSAVLGAILLPKIIFQCRFYFYSISSCRR